MPGTPPLLPAHSFAGSDPTTSIGRVDSETYLMELRQMPWQENRRDPDHTVLLQHIGEQIEKKEDVKVFLQLDHNCRNGTPDSREPNYKRQIAALHDLQNSSSLSSQQRQAGRLLLTNIRRHALLKEIEVFRPSSTIFDDPGFYDAAHAKNLKSFCKDNGIRDSGMAMIEDRIDAFRKILSPGREAFDYEKTLDEAQGKDDLPKIFGHLRNYRGFVNDQINQLKAISDIKRDFDYIQDHISESRFSKNSKLSNSNATLKEFRDEAKRILDPRPHRISDQRPDSGGSETNAEIIRRLNNLRRNLNENLTIHTIGELSFHGIRNALKARENALENIDTLIYRWNAKGASHWRTILSAMLPDAVSSGLHFGLAQNAGLEAGKALNKLIPEDFLQSLSEKDRLHVETILPSLVGGTALAMSHEAVEQKVRPIATAWSGQPVLKILDAKKLIFSHVPQTWENEFGIRSVIDSTSRNKMERQIVLSKDMAKGKIDEVNGGLEPGSFVFNIVTGAAFAAVNALFAPLTDMLRQAVAGHNPIVSAALQSLVQILTGATKSASGGALRALSMTLLKAAQTTKIDGEEFRLYPEVNYRSPQSDSAKVIVTKAAKNKVVPSVLGEFAASELTENIENSSAQQALRAVILLNLCFLPAGTANTVLSRARSGEAGPKFRLMGLAEALPDSNATPHAIRSGNTYMDVLHKVEHIGTALTCIVGSAEHLIADAIASGGDALERANAVLRRLRGHRREGSNTSPV